MVDVSPVLAEKTQSRGKKLEQSDDIWEAHFKTHHYRPHHQLLKAMDREFLQDIAEKQVVRYKETLA